MSLLLVMEHLGGLSLPGCGESSPCEQVTNGSWAKVKLGAFEWPVSYLGLTYFLAAAMAWVASRGAVPRAFRWLVRLGALGSLGFCIIILSKWLFCPYCIAAHVGNFAFWITMELTTVRPVRHFRPLAMVGSVFVLASLLLGLWDTQHRAVIRQSAERERNLAAQRIIQQSGRPETAAPANASSATVAGKNVVTASGATSTPSGGAEPADSSASIGPVFTGRYRIGPEDAPIRIVMFTGYQCPDCYTLEQQLQQLHDARSDISISIKHFPFASQCNPHVTKTSQPNGCWAARAAEAAGQLWGPEGFWKMHVWLFNRRGKFETQAELEAGIRELGYDPVGFVRVMSGEQTLQAVRADADEAQTLGLFYTPMIFINGVELKGWNAPNALKRTVEQVAATNPPRRSSKFDKPLLALDKYVADWREQPQLPQPPENHTWSQGKPDAAIKIVMWGDYQESGTTRADGIIRVFAAGRNDVEYVYRHFPFNSECNPVIKDKRHPNACRAAQAAEAAGRLAGNDGYWKMHVWLMENRQSFSDDTLRTAAAGMGFDAQTLATTMAQAEVQANIQEDIQASRRFPALRIGVPAGIHAVPTIFVNGRFVPRWLLGNQPVLDRILQEASKVGSEKAG